MLFDDLGLPTGKKRSTAAGELEKLQGKSPIIDYILDYRCLLYTSFWGSESAPYHVAIALGGGQTVQAMNENDGIQVIGITYFMPSYYVIIGQ